MSGGSEENLQKKYVIPIDDLNNLITVIKLTSPPRALASVKMRTDPQIQIVMIQETTCNPKGRTILMCPNSREQRLK